MDTVELLKQFSDPEVIKSLSLSQRVLAGLFTTILGMGITFVSLIILQCITALLPKLISQRKQTLKPAPVQTLQTRDKPVPVSEGIQKEVIAAISTALAIQLETPPSEIVIRSIKQTGNSPSK